MNALPPTPPTRRSRAGSLLLATLFLLVLAAAAALGWRYWQQQQTQRRTLAEQQQAALVERLDVLRQGQRAQSQRLQQAEATNRVMRDELLGLGQRAALLVDRVARLADPNRSGAQALRLDQVELLLTISQQRLQLEGDLEGSRRALALAVPLLAMIDDPAYLNLQQTLLQEQAALQALGKDPRANASLLLERLTAPLPAPTAATPRQPASSTPWQQRLLERLVRIQPTATAALREPADRQVAMTTLQLETSLAQAAIARRDDAALRQGLARIDGWLARLLPNGPALQARKDISARLRGLTLQPQTPLAGSTLAQLRALRAE